MIMQMVGLIFLALIIIFIVAHVIILFALYFDWIVNFLIDKFFEYHDKRSKKG